MIKKSKLIFLYCIAVLVVIMPFFDGILVTSDIRLSRSEIWNSGIGPAVLLCGLLLFYSVWKSNAGSAVAHQFFLLWAGLYSVIVGGIIAYNFPTEWKTVAVSGIIFTVLWFFSYRSWLKLD